MWLFCCRDQDGPCRQKKWTEVLWAFGYLCLTTKFMCFKCIQALNVCLCTDNSVKRVNYFFLWRQSVYLSNSKSKIDILYNVSMYVCLLKALLKVLFMFLPMPVFWTLFDQQVRVVVLKKSNNNNNNNNRATTNESGPLQTSSISN